MTASSASELSAFGSPPSAGITYTWELPSYWPLKAIQLPSGENLGNCSRPSCDVNRVATPPLVDAV